MQEVPTPRGGTRPGQKIPVDSHCNRTSGIGIWKIMVLDLLNDPGQAHFLCEPHFFQLQNGENATGVWGHF